MQSGGVLVVGCSDELKHTGLKADEKAITAQEVPVVSVSTALVIRNEEDHIDIVEAESSTFSSQISDAIRQIECKAIKIGALFSEESIKLVSDVLRQDAQLLSVIDVEPLFNTDPAPKPEMLAALREHLLPSITVLSATVPDAKALLDEAGIPVEYPKSVRDVAQLGSTLRRLGPEFVIIKREFIDREDNATTLHFVLCGDSEPVMETSRCENPAGLFGASYSIPSVIAALLAKGHGAPEAVSSGYKFVEELLKGGEYFS